MRPEDFPGGMPDAERTRFLESTGQSAGGDDAAAACALLQLACGGTASGLSGLEFGFRV